MENEPIIQISKHGILLSILGSFMYRFWPNIQIEYALTQTKVIHLIVSLIILEYYILIFHKALFNFLRRREENLERMNQETKLIEKFLEDNLEDHILDSLQELIDSIEKHNFHPTIDKRYNKRINQKMNQAERVLEELKHEEEIKSLKKQKDNLNTTIKNLIQQEKELAQTDEERKEELKEELKLEENLVFEEFELDEEKIELLIEEGYEQTNQYSIREEENISVYIKSVLNHSKSHIFLVWELKEILEHEYEAYEIREHLTKDADITFKHNKRTYALEVETGTLLKKKEQAKEKIRYLNTKYKNRWMFVVTNRNHLTKYKELGPVTERKQVTKNLDKLLKTHTQ